MRTQKQNRQGKGKLLTKTKAEGKNPLKKQKKSSVSLEEQNRILQVENKSLSEKVLELERLQQDMKAQQERLVFENNSFKQEIKKMNFELNKKTFNYICLRQKEK